MNKWTKDPITVTDIHTWFITIITMILVWFSWLTYDARSDIQDLHAKHYDLAWKVSGIDIKTDGAIQQQRDMVTDIYASEIEEARSLARSAMHDEYLDFISIGWLNMNVVRLGNSLDHTEIEVNIKSKVITQF